MRGKVMTMTVREMAEWLLSFEDQDAIVQIVDHDATGSYYCQGGTAGVQNFDPAEHTDYTDLRGNRFITPDSDHYNQRTLLLGRSE
jgi:hypothetical protein